MQPAEKVSLEEYYVNLYGLPKTDREAIDTLVNVYKSQMKRSHMPSDLTHGIAEQYRMLKGNGLPAYVWLLEAFHLLGKKNVRKQTLNYAVGMIRAWMTNGFGYLPKQEDEEVLTYFLDVTCLPEVSVEAKKTLFSLMANYGVVKLTRAISEFNNNNLDISKIFVDILGNSIQNKFGVPIPVYENDQAKLEFITANTSSIENESFKVDSNMISLSEHRNTRRGLTHHEKEDHKQKVFKESNEIRAFLGKFSKPQKLSDIVNATVGKIHWGTNTSTKMKDFMESNTSIVRAGRGYYTLKA